jgi:hypothetical protein
MALENSCARGGVAAVGSVQARRAPKPARALQTFPCRRQTFPNFRPLSPRISKDFLGGFVGNQGDAGRAREIQKGSKLLCGCCCPSALAAPGAAASTTDKNQLSTSCGFQK